MDKRGKGKATGPYRRKEGVEEKNDESPDGDTVRRAALVLQYKACKYTKNSSTWTSCA